MTIVIKAIVLALFAFILFSLGSALFFLVRDKQESTRIVKALTWRIVLSLIVFLLLILSAAMGWITPHSIS